jgi:hypothetical protein
MGHAGVLPGLTYRSGEDRLPETVGFSECD